ncbi:MAG: glutathione-disulfide reductase [Deltaproteobacteria bacterium]|nr:MAG: glutathione-disulfide reductase [Deltaproteobacteria bacterium]
MSDFDFDLFVIGAGSGGVRASRVAAQLGARVAICEERYLGGTCVNVGCVPKKLLVYASHVREEIEDAAGFGWEIDPPRFSWAALRAAKDAEIARLNGVYGRLLDNAGVTRIAGRGRIVDPHTVEVAGQAYRARHILVATGGWPARPPFEGGEHAISSNEVFHLDALPERVLIVGAGYIGTEFAAILHGFGAEVTLVDIEERVLGPVFDGDVRRILTETLAAKGVKLHLGRTVSRVARVGDAYEATLSDGTRIEADLVLSATGRRALTAGLGLEEAGVVLDERGNVVVDAYYRTSVPSILAVGDVIGWVQLTPVALAEGTRVARNLFGGGEIEALDYEAIPTAVFTQPPVGTVGLSEEQARERVADVTIFRSEFRPMKHTLSGRAEKTLMKLVVDTHTDKVLGVHMVGPDAGEIIQGFAVALRCGATKAQLDQTIGIHPTAAEELVTMRTPVA